MILYIAQLVIGLFIHFIKMPSLFAGHRPPQNYVHVLLGIAILALAAYEVKMLWCLSHAFGQVFDMSSFRCTWVCTPNGCCWVDFTKCLVRLRMRG